MKISSSRLQDVSDRVTHTGVGESLDNQHLDWLESEAIHLMREVVAECRHPALLFSGGKDSIVMLRLAEKAFRPNRSPFPCCTSTLDTIFQK